MFEIVLDTFRHERNGYMFAINAMGANWAPLPRICDLARVSLAGAVEGLSGGRAATCESSPMRCRADILSAAARFTATIANVTYSLAF